ncbi:hypothetical protein D1007_54484 [Hordeum vulgare]|nr:hypothetical protein D1007_54484 [Hordeum vulgare]
MFFVGFLPPLEFDGAVDVFDHENGPVGHPDEKPPEVGVGVDPGELEVVNVEPEVVGDGGDEAGLAGARRAVQQVPTLPCLADPPVEVLPLDNRSRSSTIDCLCFRSMARVSKVEGCRRSMVTTL